MMDAMFLRFYGVDPSSVSLPRYWLLYEMIGEVATAEHGGDTDASELKRLARRRWQRGE